MKPLFIISPGTDNGKTLVTASLAWQLRQAGKKVTALKPVASGFDPDDAKSDPAILLRSCGIKPGPRPVQAISPWRYRAALAPGMAAQREGGEAGLEEVVAFCRRHALSCHPRAAEGGSGDPSVHTASDGLNTGQLLVEGAGGLMTPLNHRHTMLDWMQALGWPCLLVTGSYLGAISHTLAALNVLQNSPLPVRAVIVSASAGSSVPLEDTVAALEVFVPGTCPVVKLPRLPDQEEPWKYAPPLSWLCDL